jgi:hypothetical protein
MIQGPSVLRDELWKLVEADRGAHPADNPYHHMHLAATSLPPSPGVGGGYLADRLTPRGLRWLVTVGASFVAVPFFWLSVKTDSPQVCAGYTSSRFENLKASVCCSSPAALCLLPCGRPS